jgi:hypothetical protein
MKRWATTLSLVAAVAVGGAVAVAVEDALQMIGVEKERARESFLTLVRFGTIYAPATAAARAVPPAQRAAIVAGLGDFVKAWSRTDDFRRRYAVARAETLPAAPAAARKAEDAIAAQKAELKKSAAEMEKMLAGMPKAQQDEMRKAMREAQGALDQILTPELVAQQEAQRAASERQQYEQALRAALPEDPKLVIRDRLRSLLEKTANVDFAARVQDSGGRKRFVSAELESKSAEWKLCYRAGAEACTAARAYAKAWLDELQ